MSLGEKFRKMFGLDDDYFDVDDEMEMEEEEEPVQPERPARRERPQPERPERRTAGAQAGPSSTKVVDIHTTAKLQVVLKKPEHFDEAAAIADELLERRTVVLNLEATAKDEAGKLLCFLSGVAYANGGKLKKIAASTYIITPYNVDVMGDLLDELENNGMFFV
jgi:cell division inhibitor SepF